MSDVTNDSSTDGDMCAGKTVPQARSGRGAALMGRSLSLSHRVSSRPESQPDGESAASDESGLESDSLGSSCEVDSVRVSLRSHLLSAIFCACSCKESSHS
jgi:hypothetical protein